MTVYRENGADGTVKVGISYAAHNDHDRDCENDHVNDCENGHVNDCDNDHDRDCENDHVNDCENDHVNDQVKWRTVAGTAVEGEDYEGAEGELVYTRFIIIIIIIGVVFLI